jgi:hypothetical protein
VEPAIGLSRAAPHVVHGFVHGSSRKRARGITRNHTNVTGARLLHQTAPKPQKPKDFRQLWCPGAESNHRHCDFQSHALPTELPGHRGRPSDSVGGGCLTHARTRIKRQSNDRSRFLSRRFRRRRQVLVQFRRRSRNPIYPGQPTAKVDLLAPRRAEWPTSLRRRASTDRTGG